MVLFRGREDDPDTLEEVVGQAVGAASVCWENMSGTGVFDDRRARDITDDVLVWISEHPVEVAAYRWQPPATSPKE